MHKVPVASDVTTNTGVLWDSSCSLILKAADSERVEQRWVPDRSPRAGLGHPEESKPDGDGLGVGTQDLPAGEPVEWANLRPLAHGGGDRDTQVRAGWVTTSGPKCN